MTKDLEADGHPLTDIPLGTVWDPRIRWPVPCASLAADPAAAYITGQVLQVDGGHGDELDASAFQGLAQAPRVRRRMLLKQTSDRRNRDPSPSDKYATAHRPGPWWPPSPAMQYEEQLRPSRLHSSNPNEPRGATRLCKSAWDSAFPTSGWSCGMVVDVLDGTVTLGLSCHHGQTSLLLETNPAAPSSVA